MKKARLQYVCQGFSQKADPPICQAGDKNQGFKRHGPGGLAWLGTTPYCHMLAALAPRNWGNWAPVPIVCSYSPSNVAYFGYEYGRTIRIEKHDVSRASTAAQQGPASYLVGY